MLWDQSLHAHTEGDTPLFKMERDTSTVGPVTSHAHTEGIERDTSTYQNGRRPPTNQDAVGPVTACCLQGGINALVQRPPT